MCNVGIMVTLKIGIEMMTMLVKDSFRLDRQFPKLLYTTGKNYRNVITHKEKNTHQSRKVPL